MSKDEELLTDFANWIVANDLQYYSSTGYETHSHFYFKGSPQRFSEKQLVKLFLMLQEDEETK